LVLSKSIKGILNNLHPVGTPFFFVSPAKYVESVNENDFVK